METLAEQLTRATSSAADTSLLQQYSQSQRHHQQQQQQQVLDSLPSAATLAAAILAQRNVYGGALSSLASTLSTTSVSGSLASSHAQPHTSQPSNTLQQAAALLGVHLPTHSSGASSSGGGGYAPLEAHDATAASSANLLQQLAQLQQQQTQNLAYSISQSNAQRHVALPTTAAASVASQASTLMPPTSFYSRPSAEQTPATSQTFAQRQLSELLLAQQQITNSRADELARQQLQNALRSQFQIGGGGVESRPVSALVQQALQQLTAAAACGTLNEHESEALALAAHQQSQLAANESLQRGLLSPFNAAAANLPSHQRASLISQQQQQQQPPLSAATSLPQSLMHTSSVESLQDAKFNYAAAMQELLHAPSQASAAAGNSASVALTSLAALHQQLQQQQHGGADAATLGAIRRSTAATAANYLQSSSPLSRRHLDVDAAALERHSQASRSTAASVFLGATSGAFERDTKSQKRAAADDHHYDASTAGRASDDAGAHGAAAAANIPTLAAFRQVPGQDIFTQNGPKKLKPGGGHLAAAAAADVHSDLESEELERKPIVDVSCTRARARAFDRFGDLNRLF